MSSRIKYCLWACLVHGVVSSPVLASDPDPARQGEGSSQAQADRPQRAFPYGKRSRLRREGYGSLTGGQGVILMGDKNRQTGGQSGESSPARVHPVLWQACVDTLKFMPLASSDAAGGLLVTDWYIDPQASDQRFKVMVSVPTSRFEPHKIAVQVHSQYREKRGDWGVTLNDSAAAVRLEKVILARVKVLRGSAAPVKD